MQLLRAATVALAPIDKARKWFTTRGDLDYTALWILYAANSLARIEVIGARLVADREVIPQAMKLNPAFFKRIYTDLLNAKKTLKNVKAAMPVPQGMVEVEYVRGAKETSAKINLPEGVSAELVWKGRAMPLRSGEQELNLPN